MKLARGTVQLSATDLANHLACRHLTRLDLEHAQGKRKRPPPAASLEVLYQRGDQHEQAYLRHLEVQGRKLTVLGREHSPADTEAAMRAGADVIVQAPLAGGRWRGIADVLLRVDVPSGLGDWSYEVVDTKLARETKGGTVLQLCLYAELVAGIQGRMPERVYVVSPGEGYAAQAFDTMHYLAYHRFVKARLEASVGELGEARDGAAYPEPVEKCEACTWRWTCDRQRRDDDHLSLVAGARRDQRKELVGRGIARLAELAREPLPLTWKPERGSVDSYTKLREQARVQLEERELKTPVHELLPLDPQRGLAMLPEPSPGDVFLDFEGDRYVEDGGIEYLFGYVILEGERPAYRARWALDREEERAGFEELVDFLSERRRTYPDCHVYHFAAYEPAALKRLMGRYASREEEVDRLLRAHAFVDLHAVVKGALRAGVERYSIKELERYYGFVRDCELDRANAALRGVQRALELHDPDSIDGETRALVAAYNRDDCVSTLRLRNWLEGERRGLVGAGVEVPRPGLEAGDPSEGQVERRAELQALIEVLTEGVPADARERSPLEAARWLLSLLVEWHWREHKVALWEMYRMREADTEELLDDRHAIAEVAHERWVRQEKRSQVERFVFSPQEVALGVGETVEDREGKYLGTIVGIDGRAGWVELKTTRADVRTASDVMLGPNVLNAPAPAQAIEGLAGWVVRHGVDADGRYRAARDLLLRRPPRLPSGACLRRPDEDSLRAGRRLAVELEGGVLPVQGPPGTGKSHTGARMILDVVRRGGRVGVTALSHKAIRNLLEKVLEAAAEEKVEVGCLQRVRELSDPPLAGIEETTDNARVEGVLDDGGYDVVAGTVYLWSRFAGWDEPVLDVLFVDEAGQLSLANALAAATAARSVVLLGDPQQLEQPQRGAHPDGADLSALEHLLTDHDGTYHETVPPDRGLFLERTWRMHATITAPLSELFYEGKLESHPDLARQDLRGTDGLDGAGLTLVPVEHEGNAHRSDEELEAVRGLLDRLLVEGVTWCDMENRVRPLRLEDVMIVAPYNAQVASLVAGLPAGANVGTVDRFQGGEAPVVIFSMTASSAEDAPRGMEFLYSGNRLNVALSRARCRAFLVACPRLFEPECRTPAQIRLANALCRLREVGSSVIT